MKELSVHARRRCQQRGIGNRRLSALLEYADVDRPIGSNCRLVRVSRGTAKLIRGFDGLAGLSAIIDDTTGRIRTVMQVMSGRRGRRYRRGT
jgi:hypothetical protein